MQSSPPTSRRHSLGFSLVETLVVLGIFVFIAASLATAMNGFRKTGEVKHSAQEFQAMILEASRIAKQERTPVRIAFIIPENFDALEKAGIRENKKKFQPGIQLLRFTIPGRHLAATIHAPPLDGTPAVPFARLPRFESMVGRWHTVKPHISWKRWTHHAVITGDLIEDWQKGGIERCAPLYLFNPPQRWAASENDSQHPLSVYPENMELTPFRSRLANVTSPLSGSETIRMKGMPTYSIDDLYGDTALPHWQRQDGQPFGDPPADETLELPALDFLADGSLAHREKDVLAFHFSESKNPQTRWTVFVRTHDSHTWIE
jgi:type II secretory pathway pseudopilin PulG